MQHDSLRPIGLSSGSRWVPQRSQLPVLLVCLVVLATKSARAMYYVTMSWLALQITGEVAAVGLVLIWWPLLSLTLGPLIGAIVDRSNRSRIFMLGEGLQAAASAGLALTVSFGTAEDVGIAALYVTACVVSLGSLLSLPAIQGLLQAVGGTSMTRVVALGASVHQLGSVVGSVLGGLIVASLGTGAGLFAVAGFLAAAACLVAPLHRYAAVPCDGTPSSYSSAVSDGFRLIFRNPALLAACVAIALVWSAAQMSSVLLAAFTQYSLGLGVDAYGWIDAMWGVGALVVGVILVGAAPAAIERWLLRFGLLTLAASTACFSAAQGLWSAVLLHGVMGMAFAASRITYDAYILRTVDSSMVGRVRNNIQAAIGAMGLAIYLLPSIYVGASTRVVYLAFGGFLAVAAAVLFVWRNRLDVVAAVHASAAGTAEDDITLARAGTGADEHEDPSSGSRIVSPTPRRR